MGIDDDSSRLTTRHAAKKSGAALVVKREKNSVIGYRMVNHFRFKKSIF